MLIQPGFLARLFEPCTDTSGRSDRFLFKSFFVAHAIPDNAILRLFRLQS